MSTEQVTSTLDDGLLTVMLNRPDKLKACTAQRGREWAASAAAATTPPKERDDDGFQPTR